MDSDDGEETFIALPSGQPAESNANVFSVFPTLCYGGHNKVDMLELRGGIGGISQFAFSRGLSSGGNLDKSTCVDLGNRDVQDAVMHYLDVCFVKVVILQPRCRTTGAPFYLQCT
eukprot:92576-Pyramimonas_sp.AAC.1